MHRTLLYRTNRLAFIAWWAAISVGVGAVLAVGLGLSLGFRAESLMFASLLTVPLVAMVTLIVLLVQTDQPGPGLTKRPFIELVWAPGQLSVRDPHGAVLGSVTEGTLRVQRINVGSRMQAALSLRTPTVEQLVVPRTPRGPWPTVPAVSAEGARLVGDGVYDALAVHAQ
ncbi:hypothetical protein [Nannocystis pusilla]|uniref:hypothetical protein n=1 Tax=Nannocystis pusilla TaxID=889268 RepID=UPI003DA4CBD6